MEIIDGKKVSQELREEVKKKVSALDVKPGLAVVIVGDDPASHVYVNSKVKKCEEVGMTSIKHELPADASEEEVLKVIAELNADDAVNGILVQMPVPKHISEDKIIDAIDPLKDVDGFHPINVGNLVIGRPGLYPCTPSGVVRLLKYYDIPLSGADVVVIGRSMLVGKPVAQLLTAESATVTLCHSRTKDLAAKVKAADIVVAAVGKKHMVTADMVKEGAVCIDVGIIREGKKLYGDIDFENVKDTCSYITPVPGGVGPMTIACLLENTLKAYELQKGK